ncbi:MAG: hypothetical protein ACKVOU_03700 [Cytophagales bacterium]
MSSKNKIPLLIGVAAAMGIGIYFFSKKEPKKVSDLENKILPNNEQPIKRPEIRTEVNIPFARPIQSYTQPTVVTNSHGLDIVKMPILSPKPVVSTPPSYLPSKPVVPSTTSRPPTPPSYFPTLPVVPTRQTLPSTRPTRSIMM